MSHSKRPLALAKKKTKPKAVVLFSGGLDSTVVTAWAIEQGYDPILLAFDYGQSNIRELKAARKLAREYFKLKLLVIDIRGMAQLAPKCSMFGGSDDFKSLDAVVIPNRNMVFVSLAATYAIAQGARAVIVGFQGSPEDAEIVEPNKHGNAFTLDASAFFAEDMGIMINHYNGRMKRETAFDVLAPYATLSKREVVDEAYRLRVPIDGSWTCLSTSYKEPCGQCAACLARNRALAARKPRGKAI